MRPSRRFMQRIADNARLAQETDDLLRELDAEEAGPKEDYPEPDRDWSKPYEP